MDLDIFIPITFFISIVYAIKVVVDARMRSKLVSANVSEDLLKSMLVVDEQQRRHASLRWGIVLSCLGVAFALVETFDWQEAGPGAIALVLGATGIGNLVFYWAARQLESHGAVGGDRRP